MLEKERFGLAVVGMIVMVMTFLMYGFVNTSISGEGYLLMWLGGAYMMSKGMNL